MVRGRRRYCCSVCVRRRVEGEDEGRWWGWRFGTRRFDVINSEHGRETISNGKLYFITDVKNWCEYIYMYIMWTAVERRKTAQRLGNPSSAYNGLELRLWVGRGGRGRRRFCLSCDSAARIKIHSNNTVSLMDALNTFEVNFKVSPPPLLRRSLSIRATLSLSLSLWFLLLLVASKMRSTLFLRWGWASENMAKNERANEWILSERRRRRRGECKNLHFGTAATMTSTMVQSNKGTYTKKGLTYSRF